MDAVRARWVGVMEIGLFQALTERGGPYPLSPLRGSGAWWFQRHHVGLARVQMTAILAVIARIGKQAVLRILREAFV